MRFADIAGLDHIVVEMKEVVKMLLNDPVYAKVRRYPFPCPTTCACALGSTHIFLGAAGRGGRASA